VLVQDSLKLATITNALIIAIPDVDGFTTSTSPAEYAWLGALQAMTSASHSGEETVVTRYSCSGR